MLFFFRCTILSPGITAFEELVKWILTRLSFVRLFSNFNQQRVWKKLKKSFLEEEGVD